VLGRVNDAFTVRDVQASASVAIVATVGVFARVQLLLDCGRKTGMECETGSDSKSDRSRAYLCTVGVGALITAHHRGDVCQQQEQSERTHCERVGVWSEVEEEEQCAKIKL
jgi:hypothetical protein